MNAFSALTIVAVFVGCESNSLSRIIGGIDSSIAYHPWQASLSGSRTSSESHFCGAAIIDDRWAVTAAHCVDGRSTNNVFVYVGSTWISGNRNSIRVNQIIMHPNYQDGSMGGFPNDIALLELSSSALVYNNVEVVPMGHSSDDFEAASECYITGWGRTLTDNQGGLPNVLQEAKIDVNEEACNVWGTNYNSQMHICVDDSANESGACNGDSGGPLVCDGVLAGVTSFGVTGCSPLYPSVYTRISSYRGWIYAHTGIPENE